MSNQGSIQINQARNTAGAPPPATVTAANNGVSLNGTTVVLGNNPGDPAMPAQLLGSREIIGNGFAIDIQDSLAAISQLRLSENVVNLSYNSALGAVGNIEVNDGAGGQAVRMRAQDGAGIDALLALIGNDPGVVFQDPATLINLNLRASLGALILEDPAVGQLFNFNSQTLVLTMGDVSGFANNTTLDIDDAVQLVRAQTSGFPMLMLDGGNGNYSMGDHGAGNSTQLILDDNSTASVIQSVVGQMLLLNQFNGIYQMGDIDGIGNSTTLTLDDTSSRWSVNAGAFGSMQQDPAFGFQLNQNAGNRFEVLNTGLYNFGDINTTNNGLRFSMDDNTGIADLTNAALNAAFSVNGVNGFTGTVTPVTSITVNGGIVTAVS